MTKKDINDIISIICPNDEDFEKTCISPAYLKKELEVLALEQEPILDRIRAEIDRARFIDKDTRHCRNALASGLEVALQIIDKYKEETEDKE